MAALMKEKEGEERGLQAVGAPHYIYNGLLCPKGASPYVKTRSPDWHKGYRRRWSVARSGLMTHKRFAGVNRGRGNDVIVRPAGPRG